MYKRFFALQKNPFASSPDPGFASIMPHTREALAGLEYGISFRKGIVVLTGEVGTGKTTLLRIALSKYAAGKVRFSYIFNPRLDVLDFLEFVLIDFGLEPIARSKASMLQQLNRWLLARYQEQEICVIMIDEAQNCSWELLEEIRLLTNLETTSEKLVQVILAGQPELETMLRQDNARQLRQRIALWCRTYTLSREETSRYIEQRLSIAGSRRRIFTAGAEMLVHELACGVPRVINLICEHALILAYVNQESTIGEGLVHAVSRDLMLEAAPSEQNALQGENTAAPSSRFAGDTLSAGALRQRDR